MVVVEVVVEVIVASVLVSLVVQVLEQTVGRGFRPAGRARGAIRTGGAELARIVAARWGSAGAAGNRGQAGRPGRRAEPEGAARTGRSEQVGMGRGQRPARVGVRR